MNELEFETEFETEGELEGEYESEQFFSRLAQLAGRALRNPTVRRIGLQAGRMALRGGLGALGAYAGGRIAPQNRAAAGAVGGGLGYGLGTYLGGLLPEEELEGEYETELNPQRRIRVHPAALMEHLGHAATEAESEAEAEAFIGALVPLAARLAPRVAPAIMRAAPGLIRGAAGVVRQLRRNPATRRFVRTIPGIVRRTAGTLTRRIARGQPVTPQIAVRALAQQTSRVLGSPQQAVQAWRRSRALDRRYHRAVGDLRPGGAGGGQVGCPYGQ
jgi:hypothetical protein